MREIPITFAFNGELPIGKVTIVTDKSISDKQLKDMVLSPGYTISKTGEVKVHEFGLIKGENYKKVEDDNRNE